MLRLLVGLPLVFIVCILVTFSVFLMGAMIKPDTGYVLFTFVWEALSAFMEIVLSGTPEGAAHMTISSVLWILLTLFVLPIGLTMSVCEIFGVRSLALQSGMSGLLTLFFYRLPRWRFVVLWNCKSNMCRFCFCWRDVRRERSTGCWRDAMRVFRLRTLLQM
jgi:hypothetical protein